MINSKICIKICLYPAEAEGGEGPPPAARGPDLRGNDQEAEAGRRNLPNPPLGPSAPGGSELPRVRQPQHPAAAGQPLRLSQAARVQRAREMKADGHQLISREGKKSYFY